MTSSYSNYFQGNNLGTLIENLNVKGEFQVIDGNTQVNGWVEGETTIVQPTATGVDQTQIYQAQSGTLNMSGVLVSATGIATIPSTGLYGIEARSTFSPAAGGLRANFIKLGTDTIACDMSPSDAAITSCMSCMTIRQFTAGDTLKVEIFQNSGGGLNANGAGDARGTFRITKF